jgi:hypothetical protein
MNAKTPRDRSLKNCACSAFFAIEKDSLTDKTDARIYGTGCSRQTNNLFAQGHDAKLVSFLVRADLASDEIRWTNGGVDHIQKGATEAARMVSGALADKAERALINALDRLAARRAPKAEAKAPKDVAVQVRQDIRQAIADATGVAAAQLRDMGEPVLSAPAPGPAAYAEVEQRRVTGKVGRWTYEGFELTTGGFFYTTNSGEHKTADAGKWTKIS